MAKTVLRNGELIGCSVLMAWRLDKDSSRTRGTEHDDQSKTMNCFELEVCCHSQMQLRSKGRELAAHVSAREIAEM